MWVYLPTCAEKYAWKNALNNCKFILIKIVGIAKISLFFGSKNDLMANKVLRSKI